MNGEDVKRLRESYGYSRLEFAQRIGYSWGSLSNVESGSIKPSNKFLAAIEDFKNRSIVLFDLEQSDIGQPVLVIKDVLDGRGVNKQISGAEKVYNLLNACMRDYFYSAEERVLMIGLDAKGAVIGTSEVSHGGKAFSLCDPSSVLTRALLMGASCIILVHNHPSGDYNPSTTDKELTEAIKAACDLMRIELLDHVIVSSRGYFSFESQNKSLS